MGIKSISAFPFFRFSPFFSKIIENIHSYKKVLKKRKKRKKGKGGIAAAPPLATWVPIKVSTYAGRHRRRRRVVS
jgi:hypothetical protein